MAISIAAKDRSMLADAIADADRAIALNPDLKWAYHVRGTARAYSGDNQGAIVSVLREVIVKGVLEIPWTQTLSACAFLLVMGAWLVIRIWARSIGEQA